MPLLFLFPPVDRFRAQFLILRRSLLARPDHLNQFVGVILHLDAPHVEHDQLGVQTLGSLDRFERITEGIFSLAAFQR